MTENEAIELLYDIQTDAVYNVLHSEKEALDMAIKALERTRWIPCAERLPEQSGWYLVSLKNRNVQKAWYRVAPINQGGSYWRGPIKRPIAWMPLPELYRESEE